ncbi:disease resistance protein RPP2B [Cajanus cajan]|uniref:disease resistance protein RPP2B n=1 Tax=Cajanus cajan TaxID=3821 RepID=UPI00098D9E53|nr:disease resistance protein RPP2B [Cajanus cajan]
MSSNIPKKYDVFLSFRGADTRTNFTSHLYTALTHKSIKTFIDHQLNRGEYVWPTLAKAIRDSHVSIVVFSENYASSTWCLKELVKILECRREQGQVVIPVFYKVDPTHIRNQSGSYEKAFAKHERELGGSRIELDVFKWKAALKEAANISGWDFQTHRDESHVIENVVNDVLQKLQLRYPTELKGLVGTEKICQKVELLLKKFSVIGIWGMGGIGKSTIAKVLFEKIFHKYDNVCFVANSKEYSLDKLFFALLKEEVPPSNVVGSAFDMRRLSSKKVFIVLDDMDSLDSFEFLCREYGDLHSDSKLIITTRDRQLLHERVEWIYKVKKWKNPESLKLFCLEAFKKRHPPKRYQSLSESAVEYAGGVPLALKVLGSYLHSKGIDFWKSTLRKLNEYPNEKIQNVLKVSYNGLDDLERNIFLDIAFFFKGKKKDHVTRILDACRFEATSGIEVLEDKALITISNSKIIQMHDLLHKMGLEIVRQECKGDPRKRSRLKDNEAREVIEKNKGTDAIQGITLDLSQIKDLVLHADTFTKMKSLRFLKFYSTLGQSSSNTYLNLPETLEPFSDKLRYIEWIGYPYESLPSPFCAKLLVEIHMPRSNVKQLWQGIQELDNLEGIDLSECKQFEEFPDLSTAPRLKWVNLSYCESLLYLHPSILSSDTLVTLILDRCTNLKRVKGEKHLKCLEKISVNGCLSLEEFAVSSDLIENLDLSNTGIQALDTSIGRMHNLKWLNLEGLRLGHLLMELSCLTSLKELKLADSGLVIDKQQLLVLFDGLRSLKILYLKDCSYLFELPDNISVLSQLQELRLDGSNVKRLPKSIKNLQELEILSLENCKELQNLPMLPSLIQYLGAINCTSLVKVSNLNTLATKMLGMTKRITFKNSLELDGQSLEHIMESLHLTMMSAAFDNVLVRIRGAVNGYNYNSVELCLQGSKVPWQITHKTTKSFISIELPNRSNLLGLIYSVVLSPAGGMKKHGTKIKCKCHFAEEGMKEAWLSSDIGGLNSDHVYVWYDPFHCDSILKYYEPKVCFEFCVANDEGEVDGSICIKECGIRLISVSDVQSVLEELNLDSNKKKDFEKGVKLETGQKITFRTIEQYDVEESNGIRNQIGNIREELSEESSSDNIIGIKIFERKENWESDDEEPLEISRKRKGRAKPKGLVTRKKTFQSYSKLKKLKKQKGSLESSNDSAVRPETCFEKEPTTAEDGGSKPAQFEAKFASSTDDNESRKQPKKSHKRMKVKFKIPNLSPSAFGKVDMESVSEPAQGKSQSLEEEPALNQEAIESSFTNSYEEEEIAPSVEPNKEALGVLPSQDQPDVGTSKVISEHTPMEIDDYLNKLDDDPFALLDFLSSNVSISSKLSQTTIQQSDSTENISTILQELRSLAFSQSLLCNIQRVEYREQVEETLKKLDNYVQDLSESQNKGLDEFIALYKKVVTICMDKSLNEEKVKKIEIEKKQAFDKILDSKSKVQKLDDVVSMNKVKIETVEKRQKEIQDAIKKLEEENEGLNKEKTKLETANSKHLTNKEEIIESVKYISTSLGKVVKNLAELDKERLRLNADFENLKEPYKKMKRSPPF